MSLQIRQTTKFRRDIKRLGKQGANLSSLQIIIKQLVLEKPLPAKYRDHLLVGNWHGHRECHIQSDWLLIYKIFDDELQLVRTGSHAELFGK